MKSFTSSQSILMDRHNREAGSKGTGCGSQIPCKLWRGAEERKEDLAGVWSISKYFSKSINEEKYSR